MKKLISLVLALAMVLMVGAALADGDTGETTTPTTPSITIKPANSDESTNVAIDYTWYRILEAEIDADPEVAEDGGATTTEGTAAYYVTSQDRATALEGTGLFNVSKVDGASKWYVELKDDTTTAEQLVAAFSADSFDLTKFPTGTFDKTTSEESAQSGTVDPGYYYIISTLGSKIALQTLTAVTINEKNEYVTDKKEIAEADANSEMGQEITYTLTVNVPVTANAQIVLTDTLSKGLTFKEVASQTPIEGAVSDIADAENDATKFTITYTAEQIQNLVAGKTETQTITVVVKAMVNGEAAIETDIPNTLDLKYGNTFDSIPKTANTKVYSFDFDKVDGTEKLPGAEFKLTKSSEATKDTTDGWIELVEVEAGKTYRLKTSEDTDGVTVTSIITTNGNTITINGLDADVTYYLVETKAPTGYNILDEHVELTADESGFVHQDIENNKGTTLPSTGGIGTTIFYVIGGVLLVGAAIILVARRKASE